MGRTCRLGPSSTTRDISAASLSGAPSIRPAARPTVQAFIFSCCCSKLGVRRGAANCSCAAAPRADSATTTDAKARTSQRAADLPVIDNLPNWSAQGLQPILRRLDPARRRLGVEFLGLGSIALRADGAPRRQDGGVVSLRQREHRKRTAGAGGALEDDARRADIALLEQALGRGH